MAGTSPQRGSIRSRLIRVAAILGVLAMSSVIALLVAELAVRLAAPQQLIQIRPDLWQPADTVGWLRRPNSAGRINTGERTVDVITDARGYRTSRQPAPPATTEILLIGDSFMEALQVDYEQSVAHLLESALADSLRRTVAVRNAGIAGWGPSQYLARTRQLLARDRFDLVLVSIFVGNDALEKRVDRYPPREPTERHHFRFPRRLSKGELVSAFLAPLNDALEVRSHLYILAKNQLSTVRMKMGLTADYLPAEYQRAQAGSPRWKVTADVARDIAREASAHHARAVFVLVPERFQVYPDDFHRYLRGFGVDSTTVDVDQPSRLLVDAFRADSLTVFDALPEMRRLAASTPERLYGRVDQHMSPAGHRALAQILVPKLLPLLRGR